MTAIEVLKNLLNKAESEVPEGNRLIELSVPIDIIREIVDAQPEIVLCKDCMWGREVSGNIECFVDINMPSEYHGYGWFCPSGERRTDDR